MDLKVTPFNSLLHFMLLFFVHDRAPLLYGILLEDFKLLEAYVFVLDSFKESMRKKPSHLLEGNVFLSRPFKYRLELKTIYFVNRSNILFFFYHP